MPHAVSKVDLAVLKEKLKQGWSYSDCAKLFNVSKQRLHQIVKKEKLEKQWKTPAQKTKLEQNKENFKLGPDLYTVCAARFRRKVQNCKTNKIPFNLTFFDIIWPTHCPILGLKLDYESLEGKRTDNSPSFDKIIPEKGYVKGNVQIISWRANRIKNDGTAEEHQKIADFLKSVLSKSL